MNFSQEEILKISSNAVLLILFCVLHSFLAREFVKKSLTRIIKEKFIRFVYVVISVLTLGGVLFLWKPIGRVLWSAEGALFWVLNMISFVCFLGGCYSVLTIRYLDFFGLRSFVPGKGNQADEQPILSTKGLYAYCRHPMYLFFGLAGFSRPNMSYASMEFLLIAAIYVGLAIPLEEGNLREELGDIYDIYRTNVPAMIPRLTSWKYNS